MKFRRGRDFTRVIIMSGQNDLLVSIRQITRAIDLSSKRLVKSAGLTAPQLLVLQTLSLDKPTKPSEIAKDVYLSQATVTSIVDRLTKAGLVRREKSDADKRVVHLLLTEAGHERLSGAPPLLQESFTHQFEALKSWEKTLLLSSVQRLAEMLNAEELDAAPILEVGDLTKPI
ncbi:MarR family transcriptional regulator [Litorimonas taeanensis]|uniref:MarR family transcriptional regulator n=1 Tax=Litorimonas taeanensis TaxID=568099 RepID=A0A420WEN1_9PROT|nr:MarR family transcriptional regulator [Litorimonas taeanensis]RKQ69405.1 MarR family transcriptional regulator [Litorimonas taeanensis]